MSKSEFTAILIENGVDAVEEHGVVIVLYEESFTEEFAKARRLAKQYGYKNSLGIRPKGENK